MLGGRTVHITKKPYRPAEGKLLSVSGNEKHFLSFLAVSRRLYAETAVLPYKLNTFSAHDPGVLREWLANLLPARRDAVASIRLRARAHVFIFPGHVFMYPQWWTYPELAFAEARGLRRICVHTSIYVQLELGEKRAPLRKEYPAGLEAAERDVEASIIRLNPGAEVTMERTWEDMGDA